MKAGGKNRFLAPELIEKTDDEKFRTTNASDVYAFAMVLWNAWSGQKPFPTLKEPLEITSAVADGLRPRRPQLLPAERMFDEPTEDRLWRLTEEMWAQKPEDRPETSKVKDEMEIIFEKAILDPN